MAVAKVSAEPSSALPRSSPGEQPPPYGRRLLVISYHYPPDGAVGGLRWSAFAKFLARRGWSVHVVTASARADELPLPDGVYVHVVPRRRTLNDVYNVTARRIRHHAPARKSTGERGTPPGSHPAVAQSRLPVHPIAGLRGGISRRLDVPAVSRGWVLRAAGAARALLMARRFDGVVSSGPPHFSHVAGVLATRGSTIPHWVDMRDPWSAAHEMVEAPSRAASAERALIRLLERSVWKRAHGIIANTREFARDLRESLPGQRIHCVPNAVDTELFPEQAPHATDGICRVAYVGTMYAARSLTAVIAALRAMVRDDPRVTDRLRLTIVGHIDPLHRERLFADLDADGGGGLVELRGVLPRPEALQVVRDAQLVLVLAQNQPLCVPAKLYESVALGTPTLAITEPGQATSNEAARIGALAVAPGDVAAIRAIFEQALAGTLPAPPSPSVPIAYADRTLELESLLLRGTAPRE